MRCPSCSDFEDKVVDSRVIDDGKSIRRRRECLTCGRRYTTFERIEEVALVVLKRSGEREPFDRSKLERGIRAALKNRPIADLELESALDEMEEAIRLEGSEIASARIGTIVLLFLREVDNVGYLRFASVHKYFDNAEDFEREMAYLKRSRELD